MPAKIANETTENSSLKSSKKTCKLSPVDDQTMAVINKVAKRLAKKFTFGYYDVEDIEQQARLIGLEGLASYDNKRPLENYLQVHIKNRLCNFKRDNFFRLYGPCEKCQYFDNQCTFYDDINECTSYANWKDANVAKLNLLYPIEFSCVDDHNESNMQDYIDLENLMDQNELKILLNKCIPVEYRHYYLRLLYGCKISLSYKNLVISLINNILGENYGESR